MFIYLFIPPTCGCAPRPIEGSQPRKASWPARGGARQRMHGAAACQTTKPRYTGDHLGLSTGSLEFQTASSFETQRCVRVGAQLGPASRFSLYWASAFLKGTWGGEHCACIYGCSQPEHQRVHARVASTRPFVTLIDELINALQRAPINLNKAGRVNSPVHAALRAASADANLALSSGVSPPADSAPAGK